MQTFLPYPDYEKSAQVLDWRRLGKQRVEAMQILNALRGSTGWSKHPATLMWKGHEPQLALYGLVICSEWRKRGYQDTLYPWFFEQYEPQLILSASRPDWFGIDAIHASHRGRLLKKDPEWYGQFGWRDSPVDAVVYARDLKEVMPTESRI